MPVLLLLPAEAHAGRAPGRLSPAPRWEARVAFLVLGVSLVLALAVEGFWCVNQQMGMVCPSALSITCIVLKAILHVVNICTEHLE